MGVEVAAAIVDDLARLAGAIDDDGAGLRGLVDVRRADREV